MAKSLKQDDPKEIVERMNKALKKMLDTPPETHKDMVERKRRKSKPNKSA